MLIDSHCHLDYFIGEIDEVLERAKQNGVSILQTIGTSMAKFPTILSIATKEDNVFCSIGVHPNESEKEDLLKATTIIDYCNKHRKIIGIGETGLDYYYEYSDRERQKISFNEHILASQELNMPIIVHTRNADDETTEILTSNYRNKNFPGLIHCFTSSLEFAKKMLDIGFYISISGIVTFKNAVDLQNIVKFVPLDRLLIETDSPYLAPVPNRGKRNEPSFVLHTAKFIASLKDITLEELASATTNNFFKCFSRSNAQQIN